MMTPLVDGDAHVGEGGRWPRRRRNGFTVEPMHPRRAQQHHERAGERVEARGVHGGGQQDVERHRLLHHAVGGAADAEQQHEDGDEDELAALEGAYERGDAGVERAGLVHHGQKAAQHEHEHAHLHGAREAEHRGGQNVGERRSGYLAREERHRHGDERHDDQARHEDDEGVRCAFLLALLLAAGARGPAATGAPSAASVASFWFSLSLIARSPCRRALGPSSQRRGHRCGHRRAFDEHALVEHHAGVVHGVAHAFVLRAGAHDEVGGGHGLRDDAHVVGARDGLVEDGDGAAGEVLHVADQLVGEIGVVVHARHAAEEPHVDAAAEALRDAAAHRLHALLEMRAGALVDGAQGAQQVHVVGNDVGGRAAVDGTERDDRLVVRVELARDEVLRARRRYGRRC